MRLFIASLNASANPPVAKELAAALETGAPQQGLPVQKLERQASAVQAGQAMGESFDQQGQEAFRWLSVTLGTQCDAGDYILVLAPQLAELDALIRWYGSQSTALRPHLGIVLAHAPGKGLPGEQDPLLSEKLYQQFSQQLSNLAAHKLTYFCTDEDLADQYLPWLRERLQYLPETVENRCRTILNTARSAELTRESITSSWGTAALLRHLLGPRRGVSLLDGVGGDLTSVLLQTLTGVESYVTTATAALPLDQLATQVGTTSLNRRGFHVGESNWPEAVASKMDLVIGSALADAQELQALWSALSDGGVLFLQGDVTQRPEGFATNGWQVDIRLPGNPGQQVASLVGRQAESYVQVRAALLNLPQHLHWLPLPAALEPAALTPARQERLWAVQAKIQAGQLAAAAKDMAQALADDPDDSELERCHASTLQALGDQEGAIAHWSHLIQKEPERLDVTEALTRALVSLGEYGIAGAILDNYQQYAATTEPALETIRKAVDRTGENAQQPMAEPAKKRLGFLQIHTFYPAYLEQFYAKRPALPSQDFSTMIKALEADAFSANHMLTPYLGALGYDCQLIVANDPISQGRWAAQHGLPNGIGMMDVVRRQVETYRPEILYLSEPISFDSRFLQSLSYQPRLVLGWRGALAPPETRWHGFDTMLSGLSGIRELALKLGAADATHFFPGHPNWLNPQLNGIELQSDVLFTGQWTIGQHEKRNQQLLALAEAAGDPTAPFSLALHLSGQTQGIPAVLTPYIKPPVYGMEMYRTLASARIVVDSRADHWMFDPASGRPLDVGRGETVNMRLFEVTGAGRFLITERFDNLSDYFEAGLEVETFSDREELIDKVRYYLAHPEQREAIARRGKERCRRDYAMEWRAAHFDRIIRRHLAQPAQSARSTAAAAPAVPTPASPSGSIPGNSAEVLALMQRAEGALAQGQAQEALNLVIDAKKARIPTIGLDVLRARCFAALNQPWHVAECLREELRFFPDNAEARALLERVDDRKAGQAPAVDEFSELLQVIRPYTMLSEARLRSLYDSAMRICAADLPGNFVECGVAAGGSSALVAAVIARHSKRPRKLFAFDSFSGMPTPGENDTHRGQHAEDTGWGTGTCAAPEDSVREACRKLGAEHILVTVKGFFEDTLPVERHNLGEIALLHLDGDWYSSTRAILDNLYDQVTDQGIFQVDDYGHWEGCRQAIEEFQSERQVRFPIEPIDAVGVRFNKPKAAAAPTTALPLAPILHFSTWERGGAGMAAARLRNALVSDGVEAGMAVLQKSSQGTDVALLCPNGAQAQTVLSPGGSPYLAEATQAWGKTLGAYPARAPFIEVFSNATSPLELARLGGFDSVRIAHFHWVAGMVNFPTAPRTFAGKSVIWTLHDMAAFTGGCHYAGECEAYARNPGCGQCPMLGSRDESDASRQTWLQRQAAYADLDLTVVAPSHWLADCARKSPLFAGKRVEVIANGIDLERFRPLDRAALRRQWHIEADAAVVLFGADSIQNRRKGFDLLLAALAALATQAPERPITLAAFGSLAADFTPPAGFRFVHLGDISDESRLPEVYGLADLLVLPSREDNLPNTAVEALACGIPVVGFRVGGLPDIVVDGETGWLAAPGDVDALAALILRVLAEQTPAAWSERCRAKAESDFDSHRQAEKYRQLYLELLTAQEGRMTFASPAEQLNWEAECLLALAEPEGALARLEQALQADAKNPRTLDNLAVLCHSSNHLQEALNWSVQAFEAAPGNPAIVLNLLHILTALDQTASAREVLQVFLGATSTAPDQAFYSRLPDALRTTDTDSTFKPRITAIVSTYKSAEFIGECLDDLLAQTVADQIEILVIDADSPQNEGEIVRRYQAKHANIRYIRTPERIGVYPAWNLAIREARGEYLISCSTNDRLKNTACEALMRELDASPEVMVVYGDSLLSPLPHQNFDTVVIGGSQFWPPYSFQQLLEQCMVGCHPMWRRKVHEELGLFDESYAAIGDQDMWLRIGEKYPLKHIPTITSIFWATSESLSGNFELSGPEVDRVHLHYQQRADYRRWVDRKTIQEIDAQLFAERMLTRWKERPALLLLTVVAAGEQARLAQTVASLQTQLYQDWKLVVLADTPAPDPIFEQTDILGWLQLDSLDDPELLARALNQVSDTLASDWLTLIPVGSTFEPHWAIAVADYANLDPKWQAIYTDHDHIGPAGFRCAPWFKPDFNLDYLRAMDYVGPALWFKHEALQEIGGFHPYPGAWQYEALWRLHDRCGADAIGHLPEPLLHLPENLPEHPLAQAARQAAVEAHLARRNIAATVSAAMVPGTLRIAYQHAERPRVSIIIPNRDSVWYLQPCIDGLLEKTTYDNYEIIVVDNQTDEPDTLDYYRKLERDHGDRVRIIAYDHPFNFSAQCNLGVAAATGEYVVLLNNDTEIVQPNWLEQMLNHGQRPEVGAVGARLVYPEKGTIQHAGVILGLDRLAAHCFSKVSMHEPGYMNRLQVDQDYSAVTAACMLVRKSIYQDLGGMNETDTPVLFNDVDFCLRLREAGHLVVWTPGATLVHHENKSLVLESSNLRKRADASVRDEKTADFMHQRWHKWLADDPAYNRHLSLLDGSSYTPEPVLVADWDRKFHDRPRVLAQPPAGGVGEYRFIAPLRALGAAGTLQSTIVQTKKYHELRYPTLTELNRLDPDVYMIQVDFSPLAVEWQTYFRKHRPDMRIVVMMDDLITHMPKDNPNYRHIPRDGRNRLRKLFRQSDRVIVSTQPLYDFARELTDEVRLVPNSLRDDLWAHLTSRRRTGKKPRVGWAGAQQHSGDLAIIAEAVKQTADEVDWIFFGMCPEEIRPYVAEYHPFEVGVEAYPAKLASLNLDLAVAPLELHPFNEAKSNLRLLEYGILGLPVICTDIFPYRTDNAPVTRVANETDAWVQAIRERAHDLDAAAREGDILEAWVRRHYLLSSRLNEWQAALTDPRP